MKYLVLIAVILLAQGALFDQKKELPIIKANNNYADVKADGVLKEKYWRIALEIKRDIIPILSICLPSSPPINPTTPDFDTFYKQIL